METNTNCFNVILSDDKGETHSVGVCCWDDTSYAHVTEVAKKSLEEGRHVKATKVVACIPVNGI